MRLAVLANDGQRKELEAQPFPPTMEVAWVTSPAGLMGCCADVYMDLLFDNDPTRICCLAGLLPCTVLIHAVTPTLAEIGQPFLRINAWPGFLNGRLLEIAVAEPAQKDQADTLFTALGRPFTLVPDLPGMIAPRVIAMIVNEAYFTLEDQVSTKAQIDMAMKLGTGYPHGPFEWGRMIGLKNIHALLHKLSAGDPRYRIAAALTAEINHTA